MSNNSVPTYRSGCPAREAARAKMASLKEGDAIALPLPPADAAEIPAAYRDAFESDRSEQSEAETSCAGGSARVWQAFRLR